MHTWQRLLAPGLLVAMLLAAVRTGAEEPAHTTFAPAPPGTLGQNQLVYLAGEAMHSQWRAVTSKRLLGASNGTSFYQQYLSIYSLDGSTYKLQYQSPRDGGPLAATTQVSGGAKMWFPIQTVQIVGAAELMQPAVQQLVVQSHAMAADCGAATVSVLTT